MRSTALHALHRLAALYLRLRGKRPPLEDMISAWSGGRWTRSVYGLPQEAPSPGEQVAGVDGPRLAAGPRGDKALTREEQGRPVAPAGQRGSVEGGPPTPTAAAKKGPPAGERAA